MSVSVIVTVFRLILRLQCIVQEISELLDSFGIRDGQCSIRQFDCLIPANEIWRA